MTDWLEKSSDEELAIHSAQARFQIGLWEGKNEVVYKIWKNLFDLIELEREKRK